MAYHIAHANIGKLLAPIDDPKIDDFKNNLELINKLADESKGFVWRLKDEESDDATAIQAFNAPNIVVNLSVWETIDDWYQYTYHSHHTDFFRRRAEWFHKMDKSSMVLWWVEAGTLPPTEDIPKKLAMLNEHGPTPLAFTFKQQFSIEEMLAHSQKA